MSQNEANYWKLQCYGQSDITEIASDRQRVLRGTILRQHLRQNFKG
jgi:hypothetical protein